MSFLRRINHHPSTTAHTHRRPSTPKRPSSSLHHGLAGSCDVATPPTSTPFPTIAPSASTPPPSPSTGAAESGRGERGGLFISNSFGLSALIDTKGAGSPGNAGYTEFTQRQQNGKRRRSTIRWSAFAIDAIDDVERGRGDESGDIWCRTRRKR